MHQAGSNIEILLSDDDVLAVCKPAGLLSVPGIGPRNQDCLVSRLQSQYPGVRIVHRLDQHTSGVIVLAHHADAHRHISRQFERRMVSKRYLALVAGHLESEEGEINLPMRKDMTRRSRHIIDREQGKQAITRWRVIERSSHPQRASTSLSSPSGKGVGGEGSSSFNVTRLALEPITGRSHQLRVHLHAIGHPILGDDLYAPPEVVALAPRLMLHAEWLTFTHPASGAPITIQSPCPF